MTSIFDDDWDVPGENGKGRKPKPLAEFRSKFDTGLRHPVGGHDARPTSYPNDTGRFSRPLCYETHKPLSIGGGTLHGGNCAHHDHLPACALYVALDSSQRHPLFDPEAGTLASCAYYPIPNMGVPAAPAKFAVLVDTICQSLQAGRRVHIGCIGGHGRTGMVIAAVVARLELDPDPITWVRTTYCSRAIESREQEKFLEKHYGCPPPPEPPKYPKVDKLKW